MAELSQASDIVLRKVIASQLTILEARGMVHFIANRRKVLMLESADSVQTKPRQPAFWQSRDFLLHGHDEDDIV